MPEHRTTPERFPNAPLIALDTVWLYVAGTLCNIECTHCFVSSSPRNRRHGMLGLADVQRVLAEASALGVKEYYFTGGEPFLNREILEILEATLAAGPATVLTNGMLIDRAVAQRLRETGDGSEYSLDFRVSLDGVDAAANDAVRGRGAFDRALAGVRHLVDAGFDPVITVSEACDGAGTIAGRERLLAFLREVGLPRPRLKVLPLLRLGAEEQRSRAYGSQETLEGRTLDADALDPLACTSGRCITSQGVFTCPILVDFAEARLGATLQESRRAFPLAWRACYTCHVEGLQCRT